MRVFMVGGTGFLGYYTVRELLARGHQVSTIALPPMPAPGLLPPEVKCSLGDIFTMSDAEVLAMLEGAEGFIYAAGLDDRVILPKPAYPKFREANVDQCMRLVRLARKAGVKKVVVYASYFTYFDRVWPELDLAGTHCYIRSRKEQREAVLGETGGGMETVVLELPYIFGTMPGRKPLWTFLVDMLAGMGKTIYYPQKSGGTAMVTVAQVAKAAAGALEKGKGGTSYPIGGVNMPWSTFIPLFVEGMGTGARVVHVPKFVFSLGTLGIRREHKREGKEGGLDLGKLAEIMYREAYLDPKPSMEALGYGEDDVVASIRESVAECMRK